MGEVWGLIIMLADGKHLPWRIRRNRDHHAPRTAKRGATTTCADPVRHRVLRPICPACRRRCPRPVGSVRPHSGLRRALWRSWGMLETPNSCRQSRRTRWCPAGPQLVMMPMMACYRRRSRDSTRALLELCLCPAPPTDCYSPRRHFWPGRTSSSAMLDEAIGGG